MNRARAITGGQAFVPFSVGGTAATLDMDFRTGGYVGATPSNLTFTRTGVATSGLSSDATGSSYTVFAPSTPRIISGSGLLFEETRTQYLGVTDTPATQTTSSLGTGTYTLWVIGTGSATSSAGTATITGGGAATAGAPNVFTVTVAGTVTVTVSGSLTRFQLENGAFPTSYIPNLGAAGTTVVRSADSASLTGASFTAWFTSSTAYTLYNEVQTFATSGSINGAEILVTNNDRFAALFTAPNGVAFSRIRSGGVSYDTANTGNGAVSSGVNKFAVAASVAAGAGLCLNGGTVATSSVSAMPVGPNFMGFDNNGIDNGFIRRVAYFPARLSNSSLQGVTT